jgi:protein TonB
MPYGAPDLLEARSKHLTWALILASVCVFALYAAAGGLTALVGQPAVPAPSPIVLIPWAHTPLPPPLVQTPPGQPIAPAPSKSAAAGVAVPVPDATVPADQTIASQPDLGSQAGEQPVGESGVAVQLPPQEELPAWDEYVYTDELPVPISQVKPVYPEMALEAGVEGKVVVRVLVSKEGRVLDAIVDPAFDVPMLREAALAAARQWTFKPALSNNKPVPVWTAIPFKFRLR